MNYLPEILLITTGGTLDGTDTDRGIVGIGSSAAEWLARQRTIDLSIRRLFNKDSREITSGDRELIIEAIRGSSSERVLITHGTFTLAETGRVLKAALGMNSKSVLLVGSWIPFAEPNSDAPSQMKFALEKLLARTPGIHIAMDNRLWNPDLTEKREVSPGTFELFEKQW